MEKVFNHVNEFVFPLLQEQKRNKMRYYKVGNDLFPSVTTILSAYKNEQLQAWRDSVGEDVANYITRTAAFRGKIFHNIIEYYLNNKEVINFKNNVLPYALFSLVKEQLQRIDNICGLEVMLYSRKYRIAGRADCVADFDGIASVIDFKSARKEKTEDIAEKHIIQETAYSIMFEEITDIPIKQVVTIVSCENGQTQTIIRDPTKYIDKLEYCIKEFRAQNEELP